MTPTVDGLTARQRQVLSLLHRHGPTTSYELERLGAGERVELVLAALRRKGLAVPNLGLMREMRHWELTDDGKVIA